MSHVLGAPLTPANFQSVSGGVPGQATPSRPRTKSHQEPPQPGSRQSVNFPPTVPAHRCPPSLSRPRLTHELGSENLHSKPTLPGPICHLYMLVARAALFLTGVIGIFCFPNFFFGLISTPFLVGLYPSTLA